jgi:hypothetical protein
MRARRIAFALAISALTAATLLAGSGGAVPRQRAVAIALRALSPTRVKGSVIVYALPAPLAAETVVSEAGPSGLSKTSKLKGSAKLVSHLRSWRIKGKAWLFWENLAPGAYYAHASRLVLVDDATGRVTVSAKLGWWPLVNGRPAAFVLRPTSFRVYSKLPKPRKFSSSRTTASVRIPAARSFGFEKDCIVFVADETAPGEAGANLRGDLAQMKEWARKAGLDKRSGEAKNAGELGVEVDRLVKNGCNDVVIFLAGHGLAKPGTTLNGQPIPTSDEATVMIGNTVKKAAGGYETVQNPITSGDLGGIAGKYQKEVDKNGRKVSISPVKFKLIIDSCFSGRFEEDLDGFQKGDDPPIREIATSSSDTNITIASGFGNTGANPNNASYWVLGLTNALTEVMARNDLADDGDLAAIIDEAAGFERENPEKYLDYGSGANKPQSSFSSGSQHPLGEPLNPPEFHIHAKFVQGDRTTTYSLVYTNKNGQDPTKYAWVLRPPENDPKGCNNAGHGGTTGTGPTFAWYHGDDQCSHEIEDPKRGHRGNADVTVSFPSLACTATYYGSQGDGTPEGDGTDSACRKP